MDAEILALGEAVRSPLSAPDMETLIVLCKHLRLGYTDRFRTMRVEITACTKDSPAFSNVPVVI